MIEVTDERELFGSLSGEEAFVLFYASWCPFCQRFLPVFENLAEKNTNLKFIQAKIDDYSNPMWENYNIDVVPTVLYFQNGRPAARLDGVLGAGLTEKALKIFIQNH